jgi:hypothetical protein
MANEAQRSTREDADGNWFERLWAPRNDGKLSWARLLTLSLLAVALSYLVLYYGGIALKTYSGLRAADSPISPDAQFYDWLQVLSRGGAIAIGALTLAWRLINRNHGQARFGTALALIAVVLFAVLVWPTPWSYKRFGCDVFQVNRIRGEPLKITTIPFCEQAAAGGAPTGN